MTNADKSPSKSPDTLTDKSVSTEQQLKEIIADELNVPIEQVTPDKRFREDLNADSLDTVELVMAIEDKMFIKIKDEEIEGFLTVGDVLTFVEEKKKPIQVTTSANEVEVVASANEVEVVASANEVEVVVSVSEATAGSTNDATGTPVSEVAPQETIISESPAATTAEVPTAISNEPGSQSNG